MSKELNRREFLKLAGMGALSGMTSCVPQPAPVLIEKTKEIPVPEEKFVPEDFTYQIIVSLDSPGYSGVLRFYTNKEPDLNVGGGVSKLVADEVYCLPQSLSVPLRSIGSSEEEIREWEGCVPYTPRLVKTTPHTVTVIQQKITN